jgi:hypothetical protein
MMPSCQLSTLGSSSLCALRTYSGLAEAQAGTKHKRMSILESYFSVDESLHDGGETASDEIQA